MSDSISYISTRGDSSVLSFKDVIFEGLAPDGGLYVPKYWPTIDNEKIESFSAMTYQQIAYEVISLFVDDSIGEENLKNIINTSYSSFSNKEITPIRKISDNHYLLELFHGPTYAFKDVAMQFIGNVMDFYLSRSNQSINVLGATSGDTGAAAIEGFKSVSNCKIFILHPHNKISVVQKKFMTTVDSKNVYNIAINGTFDDCQRIIKNIFNDIDFKKEQKLTAVNSINWIRIMCQIVYYFYASSRLNENNKNIFFSVPTGNFGDILAGYISKKMGLKIGKLNIATNDNDVLTRTLNTGKHYKKDVKATSSPSIDIQISSNFERLLYDVTKDSKFVLEKMSELETIGKYTLPASIIDIIKLSFTSNSVSEEEVSNLIREYATEYNIILDPHTAVGIASAKKCDSDFDILVSLATAHPAKFKETVSSIIENEDFVPDKIKKMMTLEEKLSILDNDTNKVKNFLKDNI